MWVIYQKTDNVIVGATAEGGHDSEKAVAIAEIVKGLASPGELRDYDAVQVQEREKALRILESMRRQSVRVTDSKGLVNVVEEDGAGVTRLGVTVEGAQEVHPVDQVPLIPASPQSFVTIRIQKVDANNKPLTRKTVDKDVLWLRTDFGFLRANPGQESAGTKSAGSAGMLPPDVRSVTLGAGTASFRLYAEPAKRLATVQILSENPNLNAAVRVEFI